MEYRTLCSLGWLISMLISKTDAGRCDRNVTSDRPPCSQVCHEQTDGYICSCTKGYELDIIDKRQCHVNGMAPVLFYQKNNTLNVLNTESHGSSVLMDFIGHIHTMAFGPNKTIFWVEENYSAVKRIQFDGDYRASDVTIVVDSGLVYPNSLTVDWTSSILYILDAGRVIACSIDGVNCSVLISDLNKPQDITIYKDGRSLVWFNQGPYGPSSCTLQTCALDGSGHMVLLSGIRYPTSLFLDETIDALFWISGAGSEKFVQMKYMTGSRKTYRIPLSKGRKTSLSVIGDHLYVASEDEVEVLDKYTGDVLEVIDAPGLITALVYHPILFKYDPRGSGCLKSPCSHLCLSLRKRQNAQFSCQCPPSMYPVSNIQCADKEVVDGPRILMSGLAGIYELPTRSIGRSDASVIKLTNHSAECLAYDWIRKELLIYDSKTKAIMSADFPSSRLSLKKLYSDVLHLESLAVDVVDDRLYWSTLTGKIYSVRRVDKHPTVLFDGFNQLRGISIDGQLGQMYVCDWGSKPAIYRCDLLGHQCVVIVSVPNGHPNMISLENGNQLYWTDSKADRIGSLDLNRNKTVEIVLPSDRNHHPVCIQTTADRIYYTDWNSGQLHSIDKAHPDVVNDLHLRIGTLYGLVIIPPVKERDLTEVSSAFRYDLTTAANNGIQPNDKSNRLVIAPSDPPPVIIGLNRTDPADIPSTGAMSNDDMGVGIILLIILLSAAFIVAAAVVTWVCIRKHKQAVQDGWMVKLVKFVKAGDGNRDDGEQLLPPRSRISNKPTFKHYDDVNYPDPCDKMRHLDINRNTRNVSMLSKDSAFTEMYESGSTICLIDDNSDD